MVNELVYNTYFLFIGGYIVMLRLSLWEILIAIPEAIIFIFGVYILSNTILNKKKIFISGILGGILVYFIRLLPIYLGVNILLFFVVLAMILVSYNNINIVKVIPALLILLITRLVTEAFLIILLTNLFNISIESFIDNILLKTLYGIPSLLLFSLIIYLIYKSKYNPDEGDIT